MNMMYGKCWAWYMAYICWTWYTANVACRYGISLQLKILLVCCVIYWVEHSQRNSITTQDLTCLLCDILIWTFAEKLHICVRPCIILYVFVDFFPYRVSYLGKYAHRTRKYFRYFFIFYIFVLHLKWDILLDWFDFTMFSMINSFFLTTDGLCSREDGNRWGFPSPWFGLPGRHTCTEIICSKYRQGKRRAKIQTSVRMKSDMSVYDLWGEEEHGKFLFLFKVHM